MVIWEPDGACPYSTPQGVNDSHKTTTPMCYTRPSLGCKKTQPLTHFNKRKNEEKGSSSKVLWTSVDLPIIHSLRACFCVCGEVDGPLGDILLVKKPALFSQSSRFPSKHRPYPISDFLISPRGISQLILDILW